jgi:hypothetical protein
VLNVTEFDDWKGVAFDSSIGPELQNPFPWYVGVRLTGDPGGSLG